MWNGIVKMEERFPGTFPHSFFVETGEDFSTKDIRLNVSFDGNRTTFPLTEPEKNTQVITLFAPING
jgi:hypothetical protein